MRVILFVIAVILAAGMSVPIGKSILIPLFIYCLLSDICGQLFGGF